MTRYTQLILTALIACTIAFTLSACTVTTVSYGIPYGYGAGFSPDAKYGHYRPAMGYEPLPSQFLPNER